MQSPNVLLPSIEECEQLALHLGSNGVPRFYGKNALALWNTGIDIASNVAYISITEEGKHFIHATVDANEAMSLGTGLGRGFLAAHTAFKTEEFGVTNVLLKMRAAEMGILAKPLLKYRFSRDTDMDKISSHRRAGMERLRWQGRQLGSLVVGLEEIVEAAALAQLNNNPDLRTELFVDGALFAVGLVAGAVKTDRERELKEATSEINWTQLTPDHFKS